VSLASLLLPFHPLPFTLWCLLSLILGMDRGRYGLLQLSAGSHSR
jgi:hypothetical protein